MSETAQQERTPLEEAAYKQMNKTVGTGYITRIVGPVVDVKFEDAVPAIYTALTVDGETPVGEEWPDGGDVVEAGEEDLPPRGLDRRLELEEHGLVFGIAEGCESRRRLCVDQHRAFVHECRTQLRMHRSGTGV